MNSFCLRAGRFRCSSFWDVYLGGGGGGLAPRLGKGVGWHGRGRLLASPPAPPAARSPAHLSVLSFVPLPNHPVAYGAGPMTPGRSQLVSFVSASK